MNKNIKFDLKDVVMINKYDTFDYEIKPVHYNGYYPDTDTERCVFYINGKDILDIIKERGHELSIAFDEYHHTTLSDLSAFDLCNDPCDPNKIHPLICECDDWGCANIKVCITEKQDSVIWDNFIESGAGYEADGEDFKLSFEFEINNYNKKMNELRKILETHK